MKTSNKDKPSDELPIRHILFAVHGAGHATKTWDMLEDAANLTKTINFVARDLCQLAGEPGCRILVVPIRWRKLMVEKVKGLGSEYVPLEDVTLRDNAKVREIVNSFMSDFIMYDSSRLRHIMHQCLVDALNEAYDEARTAHPEYFAANGKISVWAHSLGAVIMQGLLSHWAEDLSQYLDQLKFDVHHLFTVGSLAAAFMSIKSIDLSNMDGSFNFPAITGRFLNCFHPSDPVSYRLEPFLSHQLASHPPSYMMHYRSGFFKNNILLRKLVQWHIQSETRKWFPGGNVPFFSTASFRNKTRSQGSQPARDNDQTGDFSDGAAAPSNEDAPMDELSSRSNRNLVETDPRRSIRMRTSTKGMLGNARIVGLEAAGKGAPKEKLNLCKYLPELESFLHEGRLDWARLPTKSSTMGLLTGHNSYWTCKDLSLLLCTVMMYEDPRDSPLARYTGIQALKQIVEDTKTKLGKSTDGAGGKK